MRSNTAIASLLVTENPPKRGVRAPQLGLVPAARRTLCYRFRGGTLQEGIMLDMNSTMQLQPALFIGHRYVMAHSQNGPVYDNTGFTREASIVWADKDGSVPLLAKASSDATRILVHADSAFVRVPKTIYKERFFSGIITDGGIVSSDRGEMLISLSDGETIDVFYVDGSVKRAIFTNGTVSVPALTIEDQAALRVGRVKGDMATKVPSLSVEQRFKTVDGLYHELASVLAIGGKRSQIVFDMVFSCLEDAASEGQLSRRVQDRVAALLRERSGHLLRFTLACTRRRRESISHSVSETPSVQKPKGPSPERRAKMAARSQRDQAERQARRGSSEDKSLKGKKPKGK